MPTLARQIRRTRDAFDDVARRDRMLTKALLANKLALEKAERECGRLSQMYEAAAKSAMQERIKMTLDEMHAEYDRLSDEITNLTKQREELAKQIDEAASEFERRRDTAIAARRSARSA